MRVRVPEGVTAVSARQREFAPDRSGIITVPDDLGVYLLGLGAGFAVAKDLPPSADAGKMRRAGEAGRTWPAGSSQGKA
ncbi:MAG TPA: hypothetical protein VG848_04845 [Acetobacteraceae bacterium]|nr:hypothetical protein [Acetobacteraceae bacterium]